MVGDGNWLHLGETPCEIAVGQGLSGPPRGALPGRVG